MSHSPLFSFVISVIKQLANQTFCSFLLFLGIWKPSSQENRGTELPLLSLFSPHIVASVQETTQGRLSSRPSVPDYIFILIWQ